MKVGVIGTGTMGSGLVQLFSQADFIESVAWFYQRKESVDASHSRLCLRWGAAIDKNKISESDAKKYLSKIRMCNDYGDLHGLDFLIEAVTENVDVKKEVFRQASSYLDVGTVFASNTSSLSITELASVTKNKENIVGLHFFNPAPIMKLTEVVSGFLTSTETRCFAFEFAKKLGKNPVFVNEAPGFVVNRMLIPMINEAVAVFAEGVASASDIDAAMINGANHPIGPLSLADMIGNDVCLSIMEVLHNETGDPKYRAHPLLRKMVRAGKLGRKSGEGFFTYALDRPN